MTAGRSKTERILEADFSISLFFNNEKHEQTWRGLTPATHTDGTRTLHGLYTDGTRTLHGLYTDFTRTGHGLYTDGTRTGHGLYTDFTRTTNRTDQSGKKDGNWRKNL